MAFVQIEDGRGMLECAFFREPFLEYGALLSRDRILLIEGSLSDDEFSGGFSLRAKRCWDYRELCAHGRRLDLVIDLRQRDALERLEQTLAPFRPGQTSLRLEAITPAGRGLIDLNGSHAVRGDPDLLDHLRALPGVARVNLHLSRPWQA